MESGEGSGGRTWMDEGMEYVKGTRRVRYGGSVKYANRVALMSRPAEATRGAVATGVQTQSSASPRTCRQRYTRREVLPDPVCSF